MKINNFLVILLVTAFNFQTGRGQDHEVGPPHPSIIEEIRTESRLLVSGGPPNPLPESLAGFSLPQLGYIEDMAIEILEEIKHGLRYLFQTNNTHTLAIAGTGTLGIEVALSNLVEVGDTVLVLVTGSYATRVVEVVARLGGTVIRMDRLRGAFTYSEIAEQITLHKPTIVYAVMGESSWGVYQNMEGIGDLCVIHGCLTITDVVHIVGLQPFFMDKLKLDVALCNSQKGIGAPVGLAPIAFSSRAVDKMLSRQTKPPSQLHDFQEWIRMNYWSLADPNERASTVHSLPTLLLYTLRQALHSLCKEGLRARWLKVAEVHGYLYTQIEERFPFLTPHVEDPSLRLVGAVWVSLQQNLTQNVTHTAIRTYLFQTYSIDVAQRGDATGGNLLRFALLGGNANYEVANHLLDALQNTFQHFGLISEENEVTTQIGNSSMSKVVNNLLLLLVFAITHVVR